MNQYRNSVNESIKNQGLDLDLTDLELKIMQNLQWNIALITAPEISGCIISWLGLQKESAISLENHSSKIMNFCITGIFHRLSQNLDYQFANFAPSIIAISSVLASAEIQGWLEVRDKLIRKIYRTCDDDYIVFS